MYVDTYAITKYPECAHAYMSHTLAHAQLDYRTECRRCLQIPKDSIPIHINNLYICNLLQGIGDILNRCICGTKYPSAVASSQ